MKFARYTNIIVIILLIILWQISANLFPAFNLIFSSPSEVWTAVVSGLSDGSLFSDSLASLTRVSVGFITAAVISIGLAMMYGLNPILTKIIKILVDFLRPIPPIAWIPIAILIFGLGNAPAYFIVFLGAFPPIFLNSYHGATTMPKIYSNVSRSFEISKFNYLFRIQLFYALPDIFVGLKVGLGIGWMSVIAAELIGSDSGLGYFIQLNRLMLRTDNIILGMIVIGLIGYLLNLLISIIEKRLTPWRRSTDA